MNRTNAVILPILICLSLLVGTRPVSANSPSGQETEAGTVLIRYFDALTQGDVTTLRALLGGDLLKKRSGLLGNPTYTDHLIGTYGQATYKINSYNTLGEGLVSIEATISLSPEESIKKRFLLKREEESDMITPQFHIYDETAEQ
jgi:hypothetical protein